MGGGVGVLIVVWFSSVWWGVTCVTDSAEARARGAVGRFREGQAAGFGSGVRGRGRCRPLRIVRVP